MDILEDAVQEALGLKLYTIKCCWTSGDSFTDDDNPPSHNDTLLEKNWRSRVLAENARKRIDEHARWESSYPVEKIPRPTWLSPEIKDTYHINLTLDDGTEWVCYADWVGYFEQLYDVEVVELIYLPESKEYVEKDLRDE